LKLPALKPSTRTLTLLAAGAAVLFFSGVLVYTACSRSLKSVEAELAAKQKQLDESKKIAARLEAAQGAYEQAQAELAILETSVATYAYVPTLLQQLERLGQSKKLKVVAVRPAPATPPTRAPIKRTSENPEAGADTSQKTSTAKKAEPPKPYEELNIDVELEGTFWNARDFIDSLTSFPKIVAVRRVQITPIASLEQRGSPRLSVRLGVTAFIFPVKGAESPPAKPEPSLPAATKAATASGRISNEG